MTGDDLYPYWASVHEEYVDFLLAVSSEELSRRVAGAGASIQTLVVRSAVEERFLTGSVILRNPLDPINVGDYADAPSLIELLKATRHQTERALAPLTPAGLRSVRTLPANPAVNQHEANVTINWIVWKIMQIEIEAYSMVKLRWKDLGH